MYQPIPWGTDVTTDSQLRDDALRARIRQQIDIGRLPVFIPGKILAGYGAALKCSACGESVTRNQIEYHVHDPGYGPPLSLHFRCHVIWQTECIERLSRQRSSGGPP